LKTGAIAGGQDQTGARRVVIDPEVAVEEMSHQLRR
jgi:hypothetical protein